jgi:hypothetical protein
MHDRSACAGKMFFDAPQHPTQKHWRRLNGSELVAKVLTGVKFVDGQESTQQAA